MEAEESSVWSMAEGGLITRWAHEVKPQNVLPEYPRPQMVREKWMNLNGLWDYATRPKEADEPQEYDGKILVPFPIESALSGVCKPLLPDERLWYRRSFAIPDSWKGQRHLLHFGAVDWKAEIWINKRKAGEHTGGYYPFAIEMTDFLVDGENEIVVAVWDPTDTFGQERGKQTLHPKGIFYTAVSGIWQTVWIEPVPHSSIASFRLTPDIEAGELSIHIEGPASEKDKDFRYEAVAYDNGETAAFGYCRAGEVLRLSLSQVKLWSPDTPFLYDLTLRLLADGETVDTVTSYFGMRAFSVERDRDGVKRLFLNHEPLFQHGVLDQGYWPDGLYTAPTDEALQYDVAMTKKLGFNMTRKHIKVEPARWYFHCDRLGLIVWQDMVNGGGGWNNWHHFILPNFVSAIKVKDNKNKALGRDDVSNRERYRKELKEMVDVLYNVPSIGMWVPFNEAWGQFDAADTAEWLMAYDPSRPVDHASGWHDQRVGEIKSVHRYIRKLKLPDHILDRAVVISEYGGYSLAEKGHRWKENKGFGYKKYASREALNAAYTALIQEQLKPLLPKGVAAAVYTQLTDVETELNGILTYDREVVKLDSEHMREMHERLIKGDDQY